MADKIDKQDLIIQYIKKNGPVIPIEVGKIINNDSLIASAMLSGLSSMNQLKVSKMKVGGSPLYYLPGQEDMLQNFVQRLKPDEKNAYALIKARMIIRDKNLSQDHRDALQKIKDFAIMLEVELPGKGIKEIFWKWYLLSDAETESLIKESLREAYAPKKQEVRKEAREDVQEKTSSKSSAIKEELEKSGKEKLEKIKGEVLAERIRDGKEALESGDLGGSGKSEFEENKSNGLDERKDKRKDRIKKDVKRKILKKKELDKKSEEEKKGTKFKIEEELLKIQEEEREATKKEKPKTPAMIEKEEKINSFMKVVEDYFRKNDINVVEIDVLRPNEIDFVIKVPSAVGKIIYYCKAKDKKNVNEGDLSTAFVQGQLKKLPILFLTNGKLTKRAKEMQEKQFHQMNVTYLI
ncbi:MAG: hypothetical protein Q8O89_02400 [Nanoarchaeota archaeon]|nr:hypothetical protein [Nanoarchaeota archaeon]